MRPVLAALALLLAAAMAGCTTPCQELGYKFCECRGTGSTRTSCENAVDDELERQDPSDAEQDACERALRACKAPSGIDFCTWLDGEDAKIKCGLTSVEP